MLRKSFYSCRMSSQPPACCGNKKRSKPESEAHSAAVPRTFHMRKLPVPPAVPFSSTEGACPADRWWAALKPQPRGLRRPLLKVIAHSGKSLDPMSCQTFNYVFHWFLRLKI